MKIAGGRLTRDQRKQDGTDGEINESELDEGFQWLSPVQQGWYARDSLDDFRTGYTANHPNATECRGSNLEPKPVFAPLAATPAKWSLSC
jgi:hypothetical protein